jgi:AraC family transcriptional regulator
MPQAYERRLFRVLEHIDAHPAGDLSLDALADVAALSRFHFHRVFRAVTGETAAEAVRRVRLHKAGFALVASTSSVAKIAAAHGYPNANSFVRAFREAYGVTPLAFRNRGQLLSPGQPPLRKVTLMYPVEIRTEGAKHLAAVPHKGSYHEINVAFGKASALLATRNLMERAEKMIGVYYDDPDSVAVRDLRSHAGFTFSGDLAVEAPLEKVTLPAGRYAVLTFKGPYTGLPTGYDQLYGSWLPGSGEEPADSPVYELYINTPMTVAPDDLVTEIHLPLK